MHFIDDYCCTIVIVMVIKVSLDHAVSDGLVQYVGWAIFTGHPFWRLWCGDGTLFMMMMMLLCNNQEHIPTDSLHTSLAQVPLVSASFLHSKFFCVLNFSCFPIFLYLFWVFFSHFFCICNFPIIRNIFSAYHSSWYKWFLCLEWKGLTHGQINIGTDM